MSSRYSGTRFQKVQLPDGKKLDLFLRKKVGQLLSMLKLSGQKTGMLNGQRADGTKWVVKCVPSPIGKPVIIVKAQAGKKETVAIFSTEFGFIFYPHHYTISKYELSYPEERNPTVYNDLFYRLGYSSFSSQDVAAWAFQRFIQSNMPRAKKDTKYKAGPVTWWGHAEGSTAASAVVSWDHGLPTRYRMSRGHDVNGDYRYYHDVSDLTTMLVDSITGECQPSDVRADRPFSVYFNGAAYDIIGGAIKGAGIFHGRLVYVAGGIDKVTFYASTSDSWEQIGEYTPQATASLKAPWFFSPTGDEASTITGYEDGDACTQASWWITDYDFVTAHFALTDGRITISFEEEHKVYDSLEPSETSSTSSSTLPAQCEVVDDWRLFPITAPVYGDIVYLTELGTKYWEIVDYNIAQADARYPSFAPFWADDVEVANQSIADMLQYIEDTYPCPSCDRQYNPLQVGGAELRDKNNTFWDTIGMSFFIARETLNHGIVTRAEEFAERTAGGARPVAIDYGFDGEKLLVEQYRTQLLANFHETLDEHTATRCTHLDDGQYYFGTGVSITEQYINWTWETELVSSWSMKINGTNWLSISGESSFTEQSEIVTIAGEQTVTSSGAGTANYELVYLMDCDARTKSLIYTHTQMSETFESAPESQTFNGSQIWKQADRKMVALHGAATHNFNEGTFTKTFDIGEGGYYSPLYTGQCFMHHNNENVEGNYCPEDECLFAGQTKRYVGSLCVRSPEATAFSFSNESGKITFGEAEGEKEELKYASRVLLKDVLTDPVPELERELDADLVADDFRIRPIRAF